MPHGRRTAIARSRGAPLPVHEEEMSTSTTEELDYPEDEANDAGDVSVDDMDHEELIAEVIGIIRGEIQEVVKTLAPLLIKEEMSRWFSGTSGIKIEEPCGICGAGHSDLSPCVAPKDIWDN